MNIPRAINILNTHAKHWIDHARGHSEESLVVEVALDKIEFHINRALEKMRGNPEPPEPPEPPTPEPDPKLEIRGKDIYFGGKIFREKSIWRRELPSRGKGYHGGLYGKTFKFFEDLLDEYNFKFIREDAVHDIDFLRAHLQRMYEKRRVVELTLYDNPSRVAEMGDPVTIMENTKDFPNIIYDAVNELTNRDRVAKAKEICREAHSRGLICSAGAFGSGCKKYFERWDMANIEGNKNDIVGVHRGENDDGDYNPIYLTKYQEHSQPFIRTEIHHKSVKDVIQIMKDDFAMGSSIDLYYGLRSVDLFPDLVSSLPDPDPWRKYFEEIGNA